MEIDFFSAAFLSALLANVLIDLVLAGDNALIIGLTARKLQLNGRATGTGQGGTENDTRCGQAMAKHTATR